MSALQELVNIEERADVGGPRKQGDGAKLRWLVKLRRGDGKQVERKVRANTRQAIKNYYAGDFISADPMDDEDDLTEAARADSDEREKLINKIEGHTGTLESVPYHDISTGDLKKILTALTEELQEAKAVARNPAWLQNAPNAKMDKLAKLKLPDEVKRALAARLSNGEINDLLAALAK